jgi:uncharacterized protein YndB with AHSA1/START domain
MTQTTTDDTFALATPSDTDIRITRSFHAPRPLVFDAFTRPRHVRRWWGCGAMTVTACDADLRVGGAYRYVLRTADGSRYPFKGEYRQIDPPRRIVFTQVFDVEPYAAHEAVVTADFAEHDGRTVLTELIRHQSKAARDGHLSCGMEEGAAGALDRLEELLWELM